ncbi:TetR family transcriptional regulator [Vulcanibacillus modesticaldus]|uniref:TetR family transcriptional regulator n=1 Tax=Vulcanibacillus modesticaldus TaxID=337097 RepID=A0A1D2YS97_9BACI|nr:TetR/AcrR family transcriptional regulator [Vulcanibacillus modesticaldus]OEF96918.1 TetR family transcriptional regulator [Vulcanibacillus modesticaldus]
MAKKTGEKFEAILDAAVKVIAQNGYHNSQVTKIAREARVADGTIYLYFENKDDILVSLFHTRMDEFATKVKQKIDLVDTPEEKLYQLIYMHFKIFALDHNLAIVTQIEIRQSNRRIRNDIGKSLKKYHRLIEELVEFGVQKGKFHDGIDVRLMRQMIFGILDETVSSWVMKDMKYDLLELVDPIYFLIANGIERKS